MNVFLNVDIANSYDNYYETETGSTVDRIEKTIIDYLLLEIPRTEMLELGCGTGHWSDHFSKSGYQLTGIDISTAMLSIAREKKLNATFMCGDSQNLPFQDESFQLITSITMIEFVDDQQKVISEIYRVLKKGGWLVLGCLNENSIIGKNKQNDDTFRNANLLTTNKAKILLAQFDIIEIRSGVFINPKNMLITEENESQNLEPLFFGILAQKK